MTAHLTRTGYGRIAQIEVSAPVFPQKSKKCQNQHLDCRFKFECKQKLWLRFTGAFQINCGCDHQWPHSTYTTDKEDNYWTYFNPQSNETNHRVFVCAHQLCWMCSCRQWRVLESPEDKTWHNDTRQHQFHARMPSIHQTMHQRERTLRKATERLKKLGDRK